MGTRWRVAGALFGAAVIGFSLMAMESAQASSTPTFGAQLTRAPYVTDLTQTSAYVNWAIPRLNGALPPAGSVQVMPETAGVCPSSISTWSSAAIKSPTSFPYRSSSSTATTTGWGFTVTGVSEYQNSVGVGVSPNPALSPGTTYCYAVFSGDKAGAPDELTSPSFQTFTTLNEPGSTTPFSFDVTADTGENFYQTSGSVIPFASGSSVNPDQQADYTAMKTDGSQFLLVGGDVSYNGGTQETLGDLQQTQPAGAVNASEESNIFGSSYLPEDGGLPLFIADGNHGQNNDGMKAFPASVSASNSGGSYAYDAPATDVDGIPNDGSVQFPDDWYAFTNGNVRFYVLDASWADSEPGTGVTNGACAGSASTALTDCKGYQVDDDEHWAQGAAEMTWLKADLAKYPGVMKMAVFHYPLRSVVATQPDDPYLDNIATLPNGEPNTNQATSLESILSANGVVLAFNGHAHSYQRFDPTGPGQIDSYVTGGGGGVLEPINGTNCKTDETDGQVYALGWSPKVSPAADEASGNGSVCASPGLSQAKPTSEQDVYSYLHVEVNGNTVTVEPINALGLPFDVVTYVDGPGGFTIQSEGGTPPTTTTTTTSTTVPPTTTTTTTSTTQPQSGVGFVQGATSITKTVTLPAPTNAGDTLVLSASLYTGATNHITAISGTGLTWKQATDANFGGHNSDGEIWYAANVPAGITSVTVTTGAVSDALGLQEFSGLGVAPTEAAVSGSNTGTSVSETEGGSGVAVGFVAGHGSNQAIMPVSGWNSQSATTGGSIASLVTGYLPTTGTATYGGSWTTGMYYSAGVAVFSPG